jgi:hypothetical protein
MEVDVREYDQDEVESRIAAGHDLLGWAVKFGIAIHEKGEYWTKLVHRFENIPLPSAGVARSRADRVKVHVEELVTLGDEDAAAEQLLSYLTHIARAELIDAGVFPASRPELPEQLRRLGRGGLADALDAVIEGRRPAREIFDASKKLSL